MALFGTQRDVSLMRSINRELMGDIITQQCALYKLNLGETKVNIYGESSGAKYYQNPVLLNVLLERGEQTYNSSDMGVDYTREVEFRFFRDDLIDAQLVVEPGDILLYYESYFEVDSVIDNQLFVGKDPRYPYYTTADRVQITKERL